MSKIRINRNCLKEIDENYFEIENCEKLYIIDDFNQNYNVHLNFDENAKLNKFEDEGEVYYLNNKLHKEDGPAVINKDYKAYYINGKLHRTDGPAEEYFDGSCLKYWVNDKKHREDGPAIINKISKNKINLEYWLNGKRHRENGPAIEYANGDKEWWIKGKRHRIGGPAIDAGVHKSWYVNDKLHREDGPAYENGATKEWYINNKCHRLDGPAKEGGGSYLRYYINGQPYYNEQDFKNDVKVFKLNKK